MAIRLHSPVEPVWTKRNDERRCTDHIQMKAPRLECGRSSLPPLRSIPGHCWGHAPRATGRPCALHSPAPGHLQQQRLAHLEEKLRLLAQARDEAQGTCLQQKQMVAEAQARGSQLGLQVEALRRRLEELQQVTGTPGAPGAPGPRRPLTHVRARS